MIRMSMIAIALAGLVFVSVDASAKRNEAAHSSKKKVKTGKKGKAVKARQGKGRKVKIKKKFGKVTKSAFRSDPSPKCEKMYRNFQAQYHTCMDKTDNKTQCGGSAMPLTPSKSQDRLLCLPPRRHDQGRTGMEKKLGCRDLGSDVDTAPEKRPSQATSPWSRFIGDTRLKRCHIIRIITENVAFFYGIACALSFSLLPEIISLGLPAAGACFPLLTEVLRIPRSMERDARLVCSVVSVGGTILKIRVMSAALSWSFMARWFACNPYYKSIRAHIPQRKAKDSGKLKATWARHK